MSSQIEPVLLFEKKLATFCSFKAEKHRERDSTTRRDFSAVMNKQPMKENFKRYVDQKMLGKSLCSSVNLLTCN
jgi:hypothetical protein